MTHSGQWLGASEISHAVMSAAAAKIASNTHTNLIPLSSLCHGGQLPAQMLALYSGV